MQRTIRVFSHTGNITDENTLYREGIWRINVPGYGVWYKSYDEWGQVDTYPFEHDKEYGQFVVRLYRDFPQYSGFQRATMQLFIVSTDTGFSFDMLGGEVELSRTKPSGAVYDALTNRCCFESPAELAFTEEKTDVITRLPLVINGNDFSDLVQRLGYSIEYEDRAGQNAVMMLNGDEYPDILSRKPVIRWPLNMLWAGELRWLHMSIGDGNSYVPVQYMDTQNMEFKTGYFRGSIGPQVTGLNNARGLAFQSGTVLTLRAR